MTIDVSSLAPVHLLHSIITVVASVRTRDSHGGFTETFSDIITVPGQFYMTSGGAPAIDPATGRVVSQARGIAYIDAGSLGDTPLPRAGDRIRLSDGTVYSVLYSARQGRIAMITCGELLR